MKFILNYYISYCTTLIFCLLIMFVEEKSCQDNSTTESLMSRFKRELLSREKEYLKYKPLSEEMKSFINRLKRKSVGDRQMKRQMDEEKMYVVQNGEIVPFNSLDSGNDMEDDNTNKHRLTNSNFTVIPLIIPVSVPKDETQATNNEEPSLFRSNRGHVSMPEECLPENTESPEVIKQDENQPISGSTVKNVDPKLLNRVMLDLQKLSNAQNEAQAKGESADCRVEGDWDSIAGGMQIRMEFRNDSHHPDVRLVYREPPMQDGFLTGFNWSISALVPFSKQSSVVLNLYTVRGKKIIAVFTGECRICEGEETIAGSWVVQRRSKDCKDRQLAQKFVTDVLKKNNIRDLQQQNLREMEGTSTQAT